MGCAVLGPIKHQVPQPGSGKPRQSKAAVKAKAKPIEIPDDGYTDVAGVIHIHTIYSDGGGNFEDVARAGNQLGLDYLVVTDHNTLKPLREGKQGWYGMTLVLVGTEISTRSGHYLALNIHEEIDRDQPTQQIIDEVNRQGGLGFIAHPYFMKRRWTDWTVRGFTGIEGYNVAHDSLDENKARIALWSIAVPADPLFLSMLDRPYDPISKWEEMIRRHGKVVGIGSADAHEVRVLGLRIAPYELMFKLIRTHVLLPAGTSLSKETFYPALAAGHAYFSVDLIADAKDFVFMADDGAAVLGIMGDEVALVPDLRLTAILPAPAQLELFRNGRPIARTTGQRWHVPVTEPGAYRLEASRFAKPWIFSNPIYVKKPDVLPTDVPEG
jgi:hypothetical protein